jgi:hypothetical protein
LTLPSTAPTTLVQSPRSAWQKRHPETGSSRDAGLRNDISHHGGAALTRVKRKMDKAALGGRSRINDV